MKTISKTSMLQWMLKALWRFLGNVLYQGFLGQISIIEAKQVLCTFFNPTIEPVYFWALVAAFTLLFLLFNNVVASFLHRMISPEACPKHSKGDPVRKSVWLPID